MSSQVRKNKYKNFNISYGKKDREVKEEMRIENIALMCHELNRSYCQMIGKDIQPPWHLASQETRNSCTDGVRFVMLNDPTPEESHQYWMQHKKDNGWKYGPVKDEKSKTHHCMVEYKDLPQEQKIKDIMFIAMVKTMQGDD